MNKNIVTVSIIAVATTVGYLAPKLFTSKAEWGKKSQESKNSQMLNGAYAGLSIGTIIGLIYYGK